MFRRFIKDSAIYSLPTFVSRGLAFFLIPVYTRVLSPSDFGQLDMLLAMGGLVNLVAAFEISQGFARLQSDERDPVAKAAYASSAFWFTLACYLVFMTATLLYSSVLSLWLTGREEYVAVFRAAVIYIAINGVFYQIQNQLRWELRSREYAAVSLVATVGSGAAAISFAIAMNLGLLGVLWGMALGVGAGGALGVWWIRHSIKSGIDGALVRQMLLYSIPLVPTGMIIWLNGYLDRLMINHYLTLHEVGLYGIAARLAAVAGLFVVGAQAALSPLIMAHHMEPNTPMQVARIFRWYVAGALFIFTVVCLFAPDILVIITSPDFYDGAYLVIYVLPATLFAQVYVFAPGISIAKKSHFYLWISIAGTVVNGVLGWWLIPGMGVVGAAIAALTGNIFIFIVTIVISQRLYSAPHNWWRIVCAALVTVIIVVSSMKIAPIGVIHWWVNLSCICAVVAVLFFFGLIQKQEVVLVIKEMRQRLG